MKDYKSWKILAAATVGIGLLLVFLPPFNCWWKTDSNLFSDYGSFAGAFFSLAAFFLLHATLRAQQEDMREQKAQFEKQIEKQNEQIELQRQQQRDARFASGVELLGNSHESTRIGGAYSLYYLAHDNKEYLSVVCNILCTHLRMIAHKDKFQLKNDEGDMTAEEREKYPRYEVQSILNLLFNKRTEKDSIFKNIHKNLGAILLTEEYALIESVLNDVNFAGVKLMGVSLGQSTLTNVYFKSATLTRVNFYKANIVDCDFGCAKLTNVEFDEVEFEGNINFKLTRLKDYSLDEIAKQGFSLEKTMPYSVCR